MDKAAAALQQPTDGSTVWCKDSWKLQTQVQANTCVFND